MQKMDRKKRYEKYRDRIPFRAAMLFCLIFTLLQTGCSRKTEQEATVRERGITQTYTQDQLTLTQRLSKKEITIAEQLTLQLETAVPENTDVEFPRYSAGLGDFTLKDSRILPARMTGSGDSIRVVHQATYLLEPYLSGTYTVPAMTVTYRDRNNDTQVKNILTEQLEIPVLSLLGQDADRVEIKDIRPPLAMAPDRVRQFLISGLVLLLATAVICGFIYRQKTRRKNLPVPAPLRPEKIALQELDRLLAEDLLARGEIKIFHMRISDILRRYIENRFGLQAPERTTEEFLVALSLGKSSENVVLAQHKALLAEFLNQCDLVKFARHEPTLAESEKTVVICRDFVEKTKERV